MFRNPGAVWKKTRHSLESFSSIHGHPTYNPKHTTTQTAHTMTTRLLRPLLLLPLLAFIPLASGQQETPSPATGTTDSPPLPPPPTEELPPLPPVPPPPKQDPEPLVPEDEANTLREEAAQSATGPTPFTEFGEALAELVAKQRNPEMPDLTIEGAIETALLQNREILSAVQELSVRSGQFISVRAQLIPQVTISSNYGYTTRELNTVENGVGTVNDETWNIDIGFSQLIYDGGAAVSGIRAAIAGENNAYYVLRQTIDRVIAEVKDNFYQVVLNRALIIANQQSVDLLEEQLKDQENRFEAGTVPRFNVLQAEVALANAKPPLLQAQNAYRISLYRLVKLLGMDYPPGQPSDVPFNLVGKLDYEPRDIDANASIRIAVARNPALKAQRQLILGEAANVNKEVAGYLPTIRARATQTNRSDVFTSNITNMVNGWFFGVTGEWNVWDGLQTYGNVKQAKARLEQSMINYDNSVREVILEVQQAVSNLLEAEETVDSQRASVLQGVEALRLAQERLDAGAGTQLDVLNQQTSLLQSQTFLLEAYYNYISGLAEYDRALSLDTRFQEIFDDPLTNSQARRFNKLNDPERPQPDLPRAFRKQDPIKPILDGGEAPAGR